MKSIYVLLAFIIFNYCMAEDELYTYDKIGETLSAWQDTFGYSSHVSSHYENYNFGIIYDLDTLGYSSVDNLPIYAVKLTSNVDIDSEKPRLLIIGQVHAEEIYGVEIAMEIINQFLHPEQNLENKTYFQLGLYHSEIWVVPTTNPDGLRIVYGYDDSIHDATYRKNKRDVCTDIFCNEGVFDFESGVGQDKDGVDLNRNYNFNWIFGDDHMEPTASCNPGYDDDYDYYRGSEPESELEVKAMSEWIVDKNFLLSVSYHSSRSGCIDRFVIYPWAWKDKFGGNARQYSPGFDVIDKLGQEIAMIVGRGNIFGDYSVTGSSFRKGNLHDWAFRETGCIQYLIEVGYTADEPNLYGGNLLIETEYLSEVVHSNLEAFFHILMRTAGQTYIKPNALHLDDMGEVDANQVRGIVTDMITGLPINGALVRIPELDYGNIIRPRRTNASGYYYRILYPDNVYNIVVSSYGYESSDIISIVNSTSGPTIKNIQLNPSSLYEITFDVDLPDNQQIFDRSFECIITGSYRTESIQISDASTILLPKDHYRLILTSSEFASQIFDVDLTENMALDVNLLYRNVIWEENDVEIINDTSIVSIPLSNIDDGTEIMIEINWKYELEWDYDSLKIDYIDRGNTINIAGFGGDNYVNHYKYLSHTIPDGHSNDSLYIYLQQDETMNYRGVYINSIKIITGSSSLSNSAHESYLSPEEFTLEQNYPNPFNPITKIEFSVPTYSSISVSIFNIKGELIEKLVDKYYFPGNYSILFNAKQYPSGMYLYRLKSEKINFTKKFILLK